MPSPPSQEPNIQALRFLNTPFLHSRHDALFGPIGADFREACQRVSTISRSKIWQKKLAKPQHPGFPRGPPPWY
jgi:hypothetical protein